MSRRESLVFDKLRSKRQSFRTGAFLLSSGEVVELDACHEPLQSEGERSHVIIVTIQDILFLLQLFFMITQVDKLKM